MSSYSQYSITINNFTGYTPCDGYYIYTGLTNNISNANYLNGISSLIPVSNGYTFTITLLSSISFIYLFIEHCDRHIISVPSSTPKLQGGYQVEKLDLRCNDCYDVDVCDSCDFIININQGNYVFPPPSTPSITPTPSSTLSIFSPTPSKTPTPTPTPSSTNFIPQTGVYTVFMDFNVN